MKIVDYNTFVELPKGTLYAGYTPCLLDDSIHIKQDVFRDEEGKVFDWYYQEFTGNPDWDYGEDWDILSVCEAMKKQSVPLDFDIISRDGMYDYDREFLIYEKQDIKDMIKKLKTLL